MPSPAFTTADERARRAGEQQIALPETIGELVRERAALKGDATAAVWFEQNVTLSYRQLDERASRLASSLMRLGVRKGCHVGVMLANTPAYPITWIALGRLGAVMVPINTAYRKDELRFVLDDADVQFFIVEQDFIAILESIETWPDTLVPERVIEHAGLADVYRSWDDLIEAGDAAFVVPWVVGRNDLLNLQYTSGTTGFPKGCMLNHDYWVMHGANSARHRRPEQGGIENILIWAPFFYMDPMWQFLMTLTLGGTAYIADKMSLSRFFDWLIDYEIHFCIFPEPALSYYPPSARDAELSLKYISIYGWTEEARRDVQKRFSVIAREGYGMTEIGTGALVPAGAHDKSLVRTCGLPMAFREMRICDADGRDVPTGEVGELWVKGRSIFWGYYKRPQANAESFVGAWFRTGDLFRRDEDGFYYLVGRIKEMIKRSGENIAANEVEAVLRSMGEIDEAAVVAVPDVLRREEVKAYIKLTAGIEPTDVPPQRILEHCRSRLAAFKVPRYIEYMQTDFPRTASRKIAKNKLAGDADDVLANTYDAQDDIWR
ncbi:class I adenylate-forming enzyme family protein [Salinisphaera sp. T31B1]|uniref:class I adenylate-forming enzyme family protein n=1 Tax=Salinisphaera sp. T31B1 TaxID=727963 RepID=UPI00333EEFC1